MSALSPTTRWLLLVALVCSAVIAFVPTVDLEWQRLPYTTLRSATSRVKASAQRRAAELRARDAWRIARAPVVIDATLDASRRDALRVAIDSALGALPPEARTRIGVVVVAADSSTLPAGARTMALLPGASGDTRCLSVIEVGTRAPTEQIQRVRARGAILGVCAFVARFGAPSAMVQRWLEETPLLGIDATMRHRAPWVTRANAFNNSFGQRGAMLAACVRRAGQACLELINATPASPSVGTVDVRMAMPGVVDGLPQYLDPDEAEIISGFLSAMVADFGDDRFSAFWRSDAAIAENFAAATGRPLDAWIAERARERYRLGSNGDGHDLPPSAFLWALLTIGVCTIPLGRMRFLPIDRSVS
ncbi:MAG: hypothetical protein K2X99_11780 [Gemmatimonadaceae bacterium]|nr:hypothetical protein [Gemmatimonadaceae bacterium]